MTTEATNDELRARVDELESRLKRLVKRRLLAQIAFLIGVGSLLIVERINFQPYMVHASRRVEVGDHLSVIDDESGPKVLFRDSKNRLRAGLGLHPDGQPFLKFLDEQGNVTWHQE